MTIGFVSGFFRYLEWQVGLRETRGSMKPGNSTLNRGIGTAWTQGKMEGSDLTHNRTRCSQQRITIILLLHHDRAADHYSLWFVCSDGGMAGSQLTDSLGPLDMVAE